MYVNVRPGIVTDGVSRMSTGSGENTSCGPFWVTGGPPGEGPVTVVICVWICRGCGRGPPTLAKSAVRNNIQDTHTAIIC